MSYPMASLERDMTRPDTITMSLRELDRCKVIEAVVRDGLMVWRAAEKLGISRRQVERLAQRYRQDGLQGLVSRAGASPATISFRQASRRGYAA